MSAQGWSALITALTGLLALLFTQFTTLLRLRGKDTRRLRAVQEALIQYIYLCRRRLGAADLELPPYEDPLVRDVMTEDQDD